MLEINPNVVADRIQAIMNSCVVKCGANGNCQVGGQIFDTANWNLVLKGGLQYACGGGGLKERSLHVGDSSEAEKLSESELQRRSTAAERSSRSKPARNVRSVQRMEPVTFKGSYGGHTYEMNGTVTVRVEILQHLDCDLS